MRNTNLLLFILLTSYSFAQHFNWSNSIGGSGDDRSSKSTLDNNGDLIICGTFQGTMDFDPSLGVDEHTANGGWDVYVVKFDTSGSFLWAKTFGSVDWDYSSALMVDEANNIYVGGNYGGAMDIDPGTNEVLISPIGGLSSYLLKLNSSGDYQWSRNLTGYDIRITHLAKGPQGIVCGGYFWGNCEFNNEGTSYPLASDGSQDCFIMTLTESGLFQSVFQIGEPGQNILRGMDVDSQGDIYLASEFTDSIDLDLSSNEYWVYTNNLYNYGNFIAKYSSNMSLIWAKTPELPTYFSFNSIAVHSDDEIIILGDFKDSINFNQFGDLNWYYSAGQEDQFVGKINGNGELAWMKTYGNDGEDESRQIHVDHDGNIYLYDRFVGTLDADPGVGVYEVTSIGTSDNYILKLSTDGDFLWFMQDSTDVYNTFGVSTLVVGGQNDIYVTMNYYEGMIWVQNGTEHTFISNGDFDVLLAQLKGENHLSLNEKYLNTNIYPNPTQGLLTVESDGFPGDKLIEIVDLSGAVLVKQTTDLNKVQLNLNLRAGSYFLLLKDDTGRIRSTEKIIIY
jgi:hypothetical protein